MSTSDKSKALSYVRRYYPDVAKVVDAKRGLAIKVLEKDCRNGVGTAPNLCAIAKAAERHWDGAIISLTRAYLIRGNVAYRYEVPNHVTTNLVYFDKAHLMEPGTYRLEKVRKGIALGRKTPAPSKAGRKTGKLKRGRKHYNAGVRSLTRPAGE